VVHGASLEQPEQLPRVETGHAAYFREITLKAVRSRPVFQTGELARASNGVNCARCHKTRAHTKHAFVDELVDAGARARIAF